MLESSVYAVLDFDLLPVAPKLPGNLFFAYNTSWEFDFEEGEEEEEEEEEEKIYFSKQN